MKHRKSNKECFHSLLDKVLSGVNLEFIDSQNIVVPNYSDLVVLKNQFFYITDLRIPGNIYISRNLTPILGYTAEEFREINFIYECIHPEDVDLVISFSKETLKYSKECRDLLIKDPFCAVFSVNFRMKHKNGTIIWINRQTSCYRTDEQGNIVLSISLYTDINGNKKQNHIACSWDGPEERRFQIDSFVMKYKSHYLTPRELDVLSCLAEGLDGRTIAKKLHISVSTVISHRKNLLHKTNSKNTPELIRYTMEKGLI